MAIVVIQASTGTPNRHLVVQVTIFTDSRVIWGVFWDPFWARGMILGVFLMPLGSLGVTLMIFKGIGDRLEIRCFLQGFPGRSQIESTHPVGTHW